MALLSYLHPLRRLERARQASLANVGLPAFVENNLSFAYPDLEDEARALEYICLDMETTGLDAQKDQILSIGWVIVRGFHIDIGSSRQLMINNGSEVCAKTAVINHITAEMLRDGVTLDEAMRQFFIQSQGKVIVVHGCVVEQRFIDHYLKRYFALPSLPFIWLDTLSIEKYLSRNIDREGECDLRLSSIRQRYGLPEYHCHGAMIDSISTAELLLAQINRVYRDGKSCFERLYRISQGK